MPSFDINPAVEPVDSNGATLCAAVGAVAPASGLLILGKDEGGLCQPLNIGEYGWLGVTSQLQGEGRFWPEPYGHISQVDANAQEESHLDSEGNLMTRGPVLTDEGTKRDDFGGGATSLDTDIGDVQFTNGSTTITGAGFLTSLSHDSYVRKASETGAQGIKVVSIESDTEAELATAYSGTTELTAAKVSSWHHAGTSGAAITVGSSLVNLTTGTTSGAQATLHQDADYQFLSGNFILSQSQRIANQATQFGFSDNPHGVHGQAVYVEFTGTVNTTATFVTQASSDASDKQTTTVTIPDGFTSANELRWNIDWTDSQASLIVNGVLLAKHELHLPQPYEALQTFALIKNTAAAGSTTTLAINLMHVINQDKVDIRNSSEGEPLRVRESERGKTIFGVRTTASTTADQIVAQYTVPAGRTMILTGWSITKITNNNIDANPAKVGRGTMTTPASGTNQEDGPIYEATQILATQRSSYNNNFAKPIRGGTGGDVVKVTVTPGGGTSTTWSATIFFYLE